MKRKFVKDPYAWECVKVILAELDPRSTSALDSHIARSGDLPVKYKEFDEFILSSMRGRYKTPIKLTANSVEILRRWRAGNYRLPLNEHELTVLSFLPKRLSLAAVIAKDALMKAGFYEREFTKIGRRERLRVL